MSSFAWAVSSGCAAERSPRRTPGQPERQKSGRRSQEVFSAPTSGVTVLIVGQAPGKPWRPPTGVLLPTWSITRTLDRWTTMADVPLSECHFTNVVLDYVGPKGLTRKQIASYAADLDLTIIETGAEVVMPLGRHATDVFVKAQRHRFDLDAGVFYRVTRAGVDLKVVPFPHPSGRNRLLNGESGRQIVEACAATLARVTHEGRF